jgi:hypothetical protein
MKRVFTLIGIIAMTCYFLLNPKEARASYSPPNTQCWYAFNAAYTVQSQYKCPVTSANPVGVTVGTPGSTAYTFNDGFGFDIHLAYGEYKNYDYLNKLLAAANVHHVRDGIAIASGNAPIITEMNKLGAAGVKFDFLLPYNYGGHIPTQADLAYLVSLINPNDVYSFEDLNEQDICCGDGAFAAHDQAVLINTIYPYVQASFPSAKIIGPSFGGSNSYAVLGDLSQYEDFGNTHDYGGGFLPENSGFGPIGYGGFGYGSVQYNQANAKQASLSKPIAATEFGDNLGNTANTVDNLAQGTYLLRKILWHNLVGVPISYIYQLIDSGDNRGVIGADGSQRESYSEISGFFNILKDATPTVGNCIIPVVVNTAGVDSYGICKSTGEYDLVLWQPADTHDPNTLIDTVIPTINVPLTYTTGFTPTTQTYWSYNVAGVWSNNPAPSSSLVPVTDRPSIFVFNGPASPSALPTNPPVQNPTTFIP